MSELSEIGVVSRASPFSVSDTVERVERVMQQAGMTIFARIDQQAAVQAVGLTMRPMILILFGNPKGGTPLMQSYPTLAIDLPLKALVWEDTGGRVWVSTNSPDFIQRRHGLPETPFIGVPGLLRKALSPAPRGREPPTPPPCPSRRPIFRKEAHHAHQRLPRSGVFFEPMSKRRRGFPSEAQVKRGLRIVHGDKELVEKLGRNDLCPCGSGKRFKRCCLRSGRF